MFWREEELVDGAVDVSLSTHGSGPPSVETTMPRLP